MYGTPGRARLPLELVDQPEALGHPVAPVEDISHDYEMPITPDPVEPTINDPGKEEKVAEGLILSMEVGDGQNPANSPVARRRNGRGSSHDGVVPRGVMAKPREMKRIGQAVVTG